MKTKFIYSDPIVDSSVSFLILSLLWMYCMIKQKSNYAGVSESWDVQHGKKEIDIIRWSKNSIVPNMDICISICITYYGFPDGSVAKNPPANAGDTEDMGWILRSERSPGGGNGKPLQYSYLENSMDRGAWQAIVHGVAKRQTWLSMHTHMIYDIFYLLKFIFLSLSILKK